MSDDKQIIGMPQGYWDIVGQATIYEINTPGRSAI